MKPTIVIAALIFVGCESAPKKEAAPVAIDTLCLQQERKWGVDDTDASIDEARVFNETLRRRCGKKKSA